MTKSEVYSWRVSPDLKMQLEVAARDEKTSVGTLLERIAREWLDEHRLNDEEESSGACANESCGRLAPPALVSGRTPTNVSAK